MERRTFMIKRYKPVARNWRSGSRFCKDIPNSHNFLFKSNFFNKKGQRNWTNWRLKTPFLRLYYPGINKAQFYGHYKLFYLLYLKHHKQILRKSYILGHVFSVYLQENLQCSTGLLNYKIRKINKYEKRKNKVQEKSNI